MSTTKLNKMPEFEELIEAQGGVGPFQIMAFVIIESQIVAGSILAFALPYLLLYPQLTCGSEGQLQKECSVEEACASTTPNYNFVWSDPRSLDNFVTQFDLLCASHFEISFFAMCYFIGQGITSGLTPKLQDTLGRWKVLFLTSITNLLCLVAMVVLPAHQKSSIYILYFLFFIFGAATPGRMLNGYAYFQEFFPARRQNFFGTLQGCDQGALFIWLTLYFRYGNYGWQWPIIFAALINIVGLLCQLFFLPESPKWLLKKERFIDTYKVLTAMAKVNGVAPGEAISSLLGPNSATSVEHVALSNTESEAVGVQSYLSHRTSLDAAEREPVGVCEELKADKVMLLNLLVMVVVWTSGSFGYYLISYQLKYLEGDLFINGIISAGSEILANITSGFGMYALGLRWIFIVSYCIAITGMLCLTYVDTQSQFLLGLFILGSKYGVSQVFNLAYLGNIKLFPVSIVATSFGVCNIPARLATIVAPYVAELDPAISKWTFTILMIFSLLCASTVKVSKEQQNKNQNDRRTSKSQLK